MFNIPTDAYGEPTIDVPELTHSAKHKIIRTILDLEAEDDQSDATVTAIGLLYELIGSAWDDHVRIVGYDVGRAYGGPEGGGWGFNVYETVHAETILHGLTWAETLDTAERRRAELLWGQDEPDLWYRLEFYSQSDDDWRGTEEREQIRPAYC